MVKVHRNSLKPGFDLHWYTIERVLGQGGFGITYLANDNNLNQHVAVKEYLPIELAVREGDHSVQPVSEDHSKQYDWGLERFVAEAQTLAQFKHPNIVRVMTVFSANNTAYMVMEYESGESLQELLTRRGTLGETELLNMSMPLLGGLEMVHAAGFIHRDIKPANIYLREDASPVLLDFGSARQALGEETRTLTSVVSPGYAPFEQYVSKSDKQGPWTDIYGFGATLYRAVAGRIPANAVDRSEGLLQTSTDIFVGGAEIGKDHYTERFLTAVDHALAFKPQERPQTIAEWRAEFDVPSLPDVSPAPVTPPTPAADNATTRFEIVTDAEAPTELGSEALAAAPARRRFWTRRKKWVFGTLGVLFLLAIISGEEEPQSAKDMRPLSSMPALPDAVVATPPPVTTSDQAQPTPTDAAIDELLLRADADIAALRLTSPVGNNALERYQQVLSIRPDNRAAQAGLQRIVQQYVALGRDALGKARLDKVTRYLERGRSVIADDPDLHALQRALEERRQATATTDAPRTDTAIRDTAASGIPPLVGYEDRMALLRYRARLADNPRDLEARRGLRRLVDQFHQKVKDAMQARDYERAEAYLSEALSVSPDSRRLKQALEDLRKARGSNNRKGRSSGSVFRDALRSGGDGPELVVVPAGSFRMGSRQGKRGNFAAETPIHKVKFEQPFAIGTREVSRGEFAQFVESSAYLSDAERAGGCAQWGQGEFEIAEDNNWRNPGFPQDDRHPVTCISWADARNYARWLSAQTAAVYALPSEAQWEYAAPAQGLVRRPIGEETQIATAVTQT